MLITAAAFMVGGLFAVFGQIYQTGADNYEYFLAWTIFITLWALVVDYSALWLIWVVVLNLTIYFFGDQVLDKWTDAYSFVLQVAITGGGLIVFSTRNNLGAANYPKWFLNTLALGVAALGAYTVFLTAWDYNDTWSGFVNIIILLVLAGSVIIGFRLRWLGLLSVNALALIVSIAVIILSVSDDVGGFLICTIWVLATTVIASFQINRLRQDWQVKGDITGAAAGAETGMENPVQPEPTSDLLEGEHLKPPAKEPLAAVSTLHKEYEANLREEQPLGIKLLSMIGGLVGMLAIIGLLAVAGALNDGSGRAVLGCGLLVLGFILDRKGHASFLDSIVVSSITGGIILLTTVMFEHFWNDDLVSKALLALCLLVFSIVRNRLVLLLSALGIHGTLIYEVLENGPNLGISLYLLLSGILLTCWVLYESKIITRGAWLSKRYSAIFNATVLVMLTGVLFHRSFHYDWLAGLDESLPDIPFLQLLIPVILWVAYTTIRALKADNWPVAAYVAGLALLLIPLFFAPAAAPPLLVLVLSVKANHRLGLALGAAGLVYFIGEYYYDLDMTLLDKSAVLASTGIFFLLAYVAIRNKLIAREAAH